jgi:hypothetical protein
VTTGPTAVRPAGQTRGTAGTPREEGETSRGLGVLDASGDAGHRRPGGPARAGGVRRDAARSGATRLQNLSVCLRSTAFFPKFFNRSAPRDE